jgi:hypothetical protein
MHLSPFTILSSINKCRFLSQNHVALQLQGKISSCSSFLLFYAHKHSRWSVFCLYLIVQSCLGPCQSAVSKVSAPSISGRINDVKHVQILSSVALLDKISSSHLLIPGLLTRATRSYRLRRIRGGFWSCFGFRSISSRTQLQWADNSTKKVISQQGGASTKETALIASEYNGALKSSGDVLSVSLETEDSPSHGQQLKMESEEIFAQQGWLYKKDHGLLSTWQRRFVTVQHGRLVYYEKGRGVGGDQGRDIPIINCKVEEKEEKNFLHGVLFSFAFVVHVDKSAEAAALAESQRDQIVTYKGYSSYVFASTDARDRSCWVMLPTPLPAFISLVVCSTAQPRSFP